MPARKTVKYKKSKEYPPSKSGFTLLSIIVFILVVIISAIFLAVFSSVMWTQKNSLNPSKSQGHISSLSPAFPPAAPQKIIKFSDYDELAEFLHNKSFESQIQDYPTMVEYGRLGNPITRFAIPERSNMDKPFYTGENFSEEFRDYSQTNIQVQGVDEADIVKTDGSFAYIISQSNTVFIISVFPPESAEVLAAIQFKKTLQNLYINDHRLIVYGEENPHWYEVPPYSSFKRQNPFSFVKIFDVSNPRNPQLMRELNFEGRIVHTRMIEDYVYFVTQAPANFYADEPPIPRILENGRELPLHPRSDGCNCPDVYVFDPTESNYSYLNVIAVNVFNDQDPINNEVYLLTEGQELYMSQNNMYITATKRIREEDIITQVARDVIFPMLRKKDQEKIIAIEAVENYILTPQEKLLKISAILQRYRASLNEEEREALDQKLQKEFQNRFEDITKELEKTVIHKIAIKKNQLQYRTSGTVPGYVLNQFSMDEKDGYFRIATTKSRSWSQFNDKLQQSYNNLYILDENLNIVGKIERIAESERIYSVRFMQDRAYMVTFQRIDPLFVIDLKNPTQPKILGELKLPAFSTYLHPYDETTLIGLGKETEISQGGGVRTLSLKIALFDVSDVARPKVIDTYTFEKNSSSLAEYLHKAFLFSKEKNLLVIPVSLSGSYVPPPLMPQPIIEEGSSSEPLRFSPPDRTIFPPQRNFQGVYVFTVTKNSIDLKGKIDHANLYYSPSPSSEYFPDISRPEYLSGISGNVKRSFYIENALYTVSELFMKINDLNDLQTIKTVELKKEPNEDFEIIR